MSAYEVVSAGIELLLFVGIFGVAIHTTQRCDALEDKLDYLERKMEERDRLAGIFDDAREARRRRR